MDNNKGAYYFDIPSFNLRAAKDEFTVALLCVVLAKKKKRNRVVIHLSGIP